MNDWTNKEIIKHVNDATKELNKRIKHRKIQDFADIDINELVNIDKTIRKMIAKLDIYLAWFKHLSGE